jgi:hypothetical protein
VKLPDKQEKELERVDERLARVYRRAFQKLGGACRFDGARDVETQRLFMADGRSKVKNPYSSKHVTGPKRPKATAIDVYPTGKGLDLKKLETYAPIVSAMKEAALEEGVAIAWGWDLWKWDAPHWQLA